MKNNIDSYKIQPINEVYYCHQMEASKQGIPHLLVRFSGCPLRCQFGDTDFCDSWYSSIHPEKGKFSIDDISGFIAARMDINHLMITGGSPTLFPELVNELVNLFHTFHDGKVYITMETEASKFIKTDIPIDLISLSPKFSNSSPRIGTTTPLEKVVDEKMKKQHEKHRLNYDAISQLLEYHNDYQYKPVLADGDEDTLQEIEEFRRMFDIPKNKTWLMPAGGDFDTLVKNMPGIINTALKYGYNYTGRDHIIAFNQTREV